MSTSAPRSDNRYTETFPFEYQAHPQISNPAYKQARYFRSSFGGSMSIPANQTSKHLAASILDYFERYQQYALKRNDHRLLDHYNDCWLLVFNQVYGGCSLPRLRMQPKPRGCAVVAPAIKPPWHGQKYSRPARKVIAQISQPPDAFERRGCTAQMYDVLECGHRLPAAYKEDGSRTSLWRYCNACKRETEQAGTAVRAFSVAA